MNSVEVKVEEENIVEVIGNVTSPFVVLSELIKNGVDANAKSVTVHIDTINNTIKVIDNGDGFKLEDILNLGNIAASNKKRDDFIQNVNGEMLLGSKGLAFYSMFSLGTKIEVRSFNSNGEKYYFEWFKGHKKFYYEYVAHENYALGTEILISGIEEDNILLLSSEKELSKFKHISLYNFQAKITVPKVIVIKNGVRFNLDIDNVNSFEEEFNAIVSFSYESKTNILKYKYDVEDSRVSNSEIEIKIDNLFTANEIIRDIYNIKPLSMSFDDFLTNGLIERREISVPSFEGKWYMKRDKRNAKFHRFESGIRLYVNKFALYNYLNKNNDWLQLTNVSQVKKNNNFRQHNVYGYVNFDRFNEHEAGLKISNERGGFIENINYHKFMDILYIYILFITINIDYAIKNHTFIPTNNAQGGQGQGGQGQGGQGQGGQGQGGQGQGGQGQGGQGKGGQGQGGQGQGGQGQGGQGQGGQGQGGQGQGGQGQGGQGQGEQGQGGQPDSVEEERKILKVSEINITMGENCYLLDPTIINSEYTTATLKIIPRSACKIQNNIFMHENQHGEYHIDYYEGSMKETLLIKVKKRKITGMVSEDDFFTTSSHFHGDIDLRDVSGLVKQLVGLKYDDKYMLYVISFRAILEDIVKKYYSKRPFPLSSEFKDNITGMLSDIQSVMRITRNDPLEHQKQEVKKIFKGHYALNNFLAGVNVKFANENYDKFLHSLTHNPSKIDKSLALEVANDIILPLHTLSNQLSDRGII
ncbi:ATP-binding protein [Paenibacillus sp. IB182496]|uniref:ATP-binding protein n=1 Tax=Paenibacillus sabuli TaxID=2772509 RepID=A0A927BZU7_9BACL|nr:ATP-binding protein [Paenibacillus sabuli]MBD2848539.1 ATP-binding protein [Paenibacillus sabuli]